MFDVMEYDAFCDESDEAPVCPEPTEDVSSDQALVTCLNKLGCVDLDWMSRYSGRSHEQLILDLRGSAVFQDPAAFETDCHWSAHKGWQLRSQYCSGNIRRKLELAQRMNEKFPGCFDSNVAALKGMLPPSLCLEDIHVSLGAPWIPATVYAEFAKDLLNLQAPPMVLFSQDVCAWRIIACIFIPPPKPPPRPPYAIIKFSFLF